MARVRVRKKQEAVKLTLEEYAARIGALVPRITPECAELVESQYRDGRPVEKAAMTVRVFLVVRNPSESMTELLGEPLQVGERDES